MLTPLANGFDYPVGKPDAAGYYKARGFYPNGHLGEDWNGTGGGNSDMGDPIYCIGRGVVVLSEDYKRGWGNVVIVRHAFRDTDGAVRVVDSLYGHLKERKVKLYQMVERGQLLGTMGNNRGMYYAHLHFEIRKNLKIGMNRSKFKRDYSSYHSPTPFIKARRKLSAGFRRYPVPINTFAAYDPEAASRRSSSQSTKTEPSKIKIPLFSKLRGSKDPKPEDVPKVSASAKLPAAKVDPALARALSDKTVTTQAPQKDDAFWSTLKARLSADSPRSGRSSRR